MSVNQSLGPPDEWKLKIAMRPTAEQQLRDAMEAMGFPEAQSWSAGDCMAAAIAASEGMRSPWIPCSERMPEDMAVVLVWSPGCEWPSDAQYRAGVGFVDILASRCGDGWYKIRATHWTPMIAPPKE